jgi:hypothetical protein
MMAWPMSALADFAPIVRRPVDNRPDHSYPELGIRQSNAALLPCPSGKAA